MLRHIILSLPNLVTDMFNCTSWHTWLSCSACSFWVCPFILLRVVLFEKGEQRLLVSAMGEFFVYTPFYSGQVNGK